MGRTAFAISFNETQDSQLPVDAAGNLAPLQPPTGLTRPASAAGIVGRARAWTGALQGLAAAEAVVGSTKITRDCTIEAVCLIPWSTTNGTYRLVTRGKSGSSAERELWGLQVVVSGAPGAPVVQVQMRWERAGGAGAATVPALIFSPPTGWWYLAATRRWISATSCEVVYYCNGQRLGAVTSAHGDIGDGDGGTVLVGCETTGPTGMPIGAAIDELRVSHEVRSAEEIRQIYRRLFVFGGYGYELLRSLQAGIRAWNKHPDSRVQRLFQVAGDGLATAWAKGAELLEDFLPDRAWSFLDRWEAITRMAPRALDSIEARRARVVAFLRKVHGYNRDQILEAVLDLLDVADAGDLQFVEVSNQTAVTSFPSFPAWLAKDESGTGTVAATSGVIRVTAASGEAYDWHGSSQPEAPLRVRASIPDVDRFQIMGRILPTFAAPGTTVNAGIYLHDRVSDDGIFFGLRKTGGGETWFYRKRVAGVVTDVAGAALPGSSGDPFMLRIRELGNDTVELAYAISTSFEPTWTVLWTGIAITPGLKWCGAMLAADDTLANGQSIDLTHFKMYAPQSRNVFRWYIYRDPSLGGAPDVEGAQLVIDKMKPAHMQGLLTQSLELLCDDPYSVCDLTPLGG